MKITNKKRLLHRLALSLNKKEMFLTSIIQ